MEPTLAPPSTPPTEHPRSADPQPPAATAAEPSTATAAEPSTATAPVLDLTRMEPPRRLAEARLEEVTIDGICGVY